MKIKFLIISFLLLFSFLGKAQDIKQENHPYAHYLDSIYAVDTIPLICLPDMYVFPPITFKDREEELKFKKLVRDVKKTLPYAKLIYETLMETYEYIETLPTEKAREAHLKRIEAELLTDYKPVLKKNVLFARQIINKIDRQRM